MPHEKTFHVVCHECRTESVLDSKQDAERLADEHVTDSGHAVEFERIE